LTDSRHPDFADSDYHLVSVDEIYQRFSSSPQQGLSVEQAARKLKEVGPNKPSPPPSQWAQKTFTYLFGGFGSILFIAAILVFIAWKPLGQPPSIANLALAIVLVLVWVIQALFSFWQGMRIAVSMITANSDISRLFKLSRHGFDLHIASRSVYGSPRRADKER